LLNLAILPEPVEPQHFSEAEAGTCSVVPTPVIKKMLQYTEIFKVEAAHKKGTATQNW
jgi:hypothetical protein